MLSPSPVMHLRLNRVLRQVLHKRHPVNQKAREVRHTVGGLSAHADRAGLLAWYGGFTNRPPVCLVHGEPTAQEALAAGLEKAFGALVRVPARGDVLTL